MRRRTLVGGSLAAGLLIALLSGGAPAGGADSAFRVDKLILTTFDGEQEPFLRHQRWDRTFPAAGGEFAPSSATPPAPTGSGSAPTGPTRPTTSCGNGSPRSTRATAATAAPASSRTRRSPGR